MNVRFSNNDFMQHAMARAQAAIELGTFKKRLDVRRAVSEWWNDNDDHVETYDRLIDACRLATEDAYTSEDDVVGAYLEAANSNDNDGKPTGDAIHFLSAFIAAAVREKNLLPP